MKSMAIMALAFALLATRGSSRAGEPAERVDESTAVRLACAHSRELAAARARMTSARMAIGERWREFLPAASVQYSEDDTVSAGGPDTRNRQVMMSLSYDLHTGGATVDAYAIAQIEHLAALENYRMERAALSLGVRKEYYGLQGAEGEVSIQRDLLESLLVQRKIIDEESRQGMATELQRVQADARIAEVEYELLRAENAFRTGTKNFRLLIGASREVRIVPVTAGESDSPAREARGGKSGAVAGALLRRPEMRMAGLAVRKARAGVRLARDYSLPVIRFTGSYGYRGERYPLDDRFWNVGITLSASLFGNGVSSGMSYGEAGYGKEKSVAHNAQADILDDPSGARRTAEAEFALRDAMAEMERTRMKIIVDVERACDRMGETAELVRLARLNVSLLERQAAAEDARARVGDIARYEVLRTYVDLAKARLRLQAAVGERRVSFAELDAALGEDGGSETPVGGEL
ncbi:MAG: TolC family protein [Spirochaetes bacterium]|nr:MAG: TolC family protein [Spirochaetota bacterium]